MADMGIVVLQVCLLLPAYLDTVQSVTYLVMFLLVQFAHINLYRTNAPDPFKSASYECTKWVRCGHLNPPHSPVQA